MSKTQRIASIDIFRALTMFLMIFVNDLWTVIHVPDWMEHAKASEDTMGLADWVFPGFLFIVGLSIPIAIEARRKKGESTLDIFWHILKRSTALVVMGFYMVNLENINNDLLPFSKYFWEILMATAIVLIWNVYPNHKAFKKIPQWAMQIAGIVVFIFLSVVYKSGTAENPTWLEPHWWGILGIIGWAYLLCATVYLLVGKKIIWIALVLVVFQFLNAMQFIDFFGYKLSINFMVSASNHASITSGIVATLLYLEYGKTGNVSKFLSFIFILAVLFVAYGFITRPEWGISKIKATPSWTSICAGISFAAFGILYIVADVWKKTSWANPIGPAGRSTLTCYLVPYFYYGIMALVGIYLPEFFKTGFIGIIKSLLFAYLIIFITGQLEKLNIRLKI
jgi:predicted acyltransferase